MRNEDQNQLYPVFLKLDRLKLLIIGGEEIGYEKLSHMLKTSPNAKITVVAPWISNDIYHLIGEYPYQLRVQKKCFERSDVELGDLIIGATTNQKLNEEIYYAAKAAGKLVSILDTPKLSDFHFGSIVCRGNLKVAISTNGRSPIFAKRFRQVLEDILPEETNSLVKNLSSIRNRLKGGFSSKVKKLNKLTERLLMNEKDPEAKSDSIIIKKNDDYAAPSR